MARAGLGGGMGRLGARARYGAASTAAVGGAALLTGETDGFATDFTYATDAQRVAVKTAGAVVSSGTSFFTSSGTSSKWVYDVTGTLVNIPVGTLPLDYDPVTHAAKGLRVEPAATNMFVFSHDYSAINVTAGTVAVNNQAGPEGTLTADTFTENTAADFHGAYGGPLGGITANIDYTVSRFIKMGTRRYATMGWSDGTNCAYGVYDLQSGTVGSSGITGTGIKNSASIEAGSNGWYRCILSGKINSSAIYVNFGAANAATITPDGHGRQSFAGTSATLIFGPGQIETGTVATSLIPTLAGIAVTRAVDVISIAPASINYSATAGSWWVEHYLLEGSTDRRMIDYNNASIPLFYNSGGYQMSDGTQFYILGSTLGAVNKAISAFQSGSRAITFNGLTPVTDAGAVTNLLSPTTIYFSAKPGFPAANTLGYIRKVRYLPRRPSNAELQTMTT